MGSLWPGLGAWLVDPRLWVEYWKLFPWMLLYRDALSKPFSQPGFIPPHVASLTLAAGEASGQHTAHLPRPPGLEETSCPRVGTFLKAAVAHDSGQYQPVKVEAQQGSPGPLLL